MSEADGMWVEWCKAWRDGPLVGLVSGLLVDWRVRYDDGCVLVRMDEDVDRLLEEAIAVLAELRWRYDPGRTLQMVLPGVMEGQAPAEGRLGLPVQDGEEVGE